MTMVAVEVSEQDVRESIAVARSHGEKFFEQVVWQVENAAWSVLGYVSWDAMRDAEYGDMGVVAPRADRPELVARLRSRGLTQQQIGDTLGVSQGQVSADLNISSDIEDSPESITNTRGQSRPANYTRKETTKVEESTTVDLDTGEVIDDAPIGEKTYSRPEPAAPRRSSLIDDARNTGWQLRKAIERLERIHTDDRFSKNKVEVMAALQPHLDLANEVLSNL